VLGSAIAARGSRLDVRDLSLVRVYDPGILAEQNSSVVVQGGYAEDVSLVAVSSDGSHVRIEDTVIRRAGTAGLAAYAGGPGGRPASVHASGLTFADEHAVLARVQPGSSVRLEGQAIGAKAFDTDLLKWRGGITTTIRPLGYSLGTSIWLAGYDLVRPDLEPGEPLQFTLYWYAAAPLDHDYTIFVHLYDAAGEMVAGGDTMPRQGTYPTTAWQAGFKVIDPHLVPLDLGPGEYHIALGMYHLASGQRLPVLRRDGEPVADARILLDQAFRVKER
jgi:hypothetical protein